MVLRSRAKSTAAVLALAAAFLLGTAFAVAHQWGWGGTVSISAQGAGVPAGVILFIDSGSCPVGYTEVAGFNGQMLRGTLAANADVNTTGGADTITPAGTVSQPTFAGTSSTVVVNHVHVQAVNSGTTGALSGYTPDTSTSTSATSGYSTANPTGGAASYTPAGTVSQPTFTGTSFDNRAAFLRLIACKKN